MYSEQKEALAQEIELKRPAVLGRSAACDNRRQDDAAGKASACPAQPGAESGHYQVTTAMISLPMSPAPTATVCGKRGPGGAVYSGQRYLLTEMFRLTEQDLLALFERHGYDLVLLEGFKDSGWPKIEVVRKEISDTPVSFQPLAVVGDIPGADFWIGRCAGSGRLARCPDAGPVRRRQT